MCIVSSTVVHYWYKYMQLYIKLWVCCYTRLEAPSLLSLWKLSNKVVKNISVIDPNTFLYAPYPAPYHAVNCSFHQNIVTHSLSFNSCLLVSFIFIAYLSWACGSLHEPRNWVFFSLVCHSFLKWINFSQTSGRLAFIDWLTWTIFL